MPGDSITLPSQACSCERLSDDALGTRFRYHRKLVAVSNLARMTRLYYHRKLVDESTKDESFTLLIEWALSRSSTDS